MIDPAALWPAAAVAVFAVSVFDVGMAFLMRIIRETSPDVDRD